MSETLVITQTFEERDFFIQLLRNEPDRVGKPYRDFVDSFDRIKNAWSNDKPYAYFVLDNDKYNFGWQDARTIDRLHDFIMSYHTRAKCMYLHDYLGAFPPVIRNINMSSETLWDFI